MPILRSKLCILAVAASVLTSCTPPPPAPVGKVTLTVTVSAVLGKTAAFRFIANGDYKTKGSKDWRFSGQNHVDEQTFLVGQDYKIEEPESTYHVAKAALTYSATSAEVKTELADSPSVEFILDTEGNVPLLIKNKDGALLKAPVKVQAGKTVYTIAPANP